MVTTASRVLDGPHPVRILVGSEQSHTLYEFISDDYQRWREPFNCSFDWSSWTDWPTPSR